MNFGAAVLVLAMALVAALALVGVRSTSAQAPPPGPRPVAADDIPNESRFFDADGDKVYDNLENRMGQSPPGEALDVVVLFNQPLDEVNFQGLRGLLGGAGQLPVRAQFPGVQGIATNLNPGRIRVLAAQGMVLQIEGDDAAETYLDPATYWFGVQRSRLDFPGITGAGTTIAIVDSGIDASHQDLDDGKVAAWVDLTGILGSTPCPTACDPLGHGTHVASIAAGGDPAGDSPQRGVAPGASLAGVRVLNDAGAGNRTSLNLGLQWVLDNLGNSVTPPIGVMNMSLGFSGCSDGQSSTERLINAIVAAGVVVTVSAGNSGSNQCTVGDPGAAQHAITVGAMAGPEHGTGVIFGCGSAPVGGFYLACFSSRGPTFDNRVKPDLSGPGVQIVAAQAGTPSGYVAKSGTSMSSPFVAGVAALLRQAGLSAPDGVCTTTNGVHSCTIGNPVKDTLMSTAQCWGSLTCPNIDYGAGRLDAYAAVRSALNATGDNVRVGEHAPLIQGTLNGTGDARTHVFNVKSLFFPIGVSMIMVDNPACSGAFTCETDFDLQLTDPLGNVVDTSLSLRRQETVGIVPTLKGDYTLTVSSFSGNGDYTVDISAGTALLPAPQVAVITDGQTDFGIVQLGLTATSLESEVIEMALGPGEMIIQSTRFSDGSGSTWELGDSSGSDQVLWEFSTDGSGWVAFTQPGLAFQLTQGVLRDGEVQEVFFRLTMPTHTASGDDFSAIVTISGISPD
jgi:serine protease AprX